MACNHMCTTHHVPNVDVVDLKTQKSKKIDIKLVTISQTVVKMRSKLTRQTIAARTFTVGMFFAHMNFQRFLVLVMPIALRTFEGFARVACGHLNATV
jgi:hypothetical protein